MARNEEDQAITYLVVMNHEEQYSIWPAHKAAPQGWRAVGKDGTKQECLDYIAHAWTDMRPASLRTQIEEMTRVAPDTADKTPRE